MKRHFCLWQITWMSALLLFFLRRRAWNMVRNESAILSGLFAVYFWRVFRAQKKKKDFETVTASLRRESFHAKASRHSSKRSCFYYQRCLCAELLAFLFSMINRCTLRQAYIPTYTYFFIYFFGVYKRRKK